MGHVERGGVSNTNKEESDNERMSSKNRPKSKVSLPVHMHVEIIVHTPHMHTTLHKYPLHFSHDISLPPNLTSFSLTRDIQREEVVYPVKRNLTMKTCHPKTGQTQK